MGQGAILKRASVVPLRTKDREEGMTWEKTRIPSACSQVMVFLQHTGIRAAGEVTHRTWESAPQHVCGQITLEPWAGNSTMNIMF